MINQLMVEGISEFDLIKNYKGVSLVSLLKGSTNKINIFNFFDTDPRKWNGNNKKSIDLNTNVNFISIV